MCKEKYSFPSSKQKYAFPHSLSSMSVVSIFHGLISLYFQIKRMIDTYIFYFYLTYGMLFSKLSLVEPQFRVQKIQANHH